MTDRAVLVSGGAGGIGRALCQTFAAAGFRVIATDLPGLAVPSCGISLPVDLAELVTSSDIRENFREQVVSSLEAVGARLVCLVNNAAVQALGGLDTIDVAQFLASFRINVEAPLILSRMFLAQLREARGTIVNVGSVHARCTKPGFGAYSVSKSALAGLTRAMALDFADAVTVNSISPGAIDSAMLREGFANDSSGLRALVEHQPIGRIGRPEEVAQIALFLASGAARFVTGADFRADGGISVRLHDPA